MDTEAIVARAPEVALVDELAHTNIPGSRRAKRWEDVVDLLAQGITVITTVNIQHLASLNDVVANITGIRQQETVPDWVLDLADQVELVDMSPHALQRRMVHGNVYPDARKAELALRRFFTSENLTALRELALMRVANLVDDELLQRWSKGHVPETRERVLVCVSLPGFSEYLVRRGCRIAQRAGGDLLVVHVRTEDEPPDPEWLKEMDQLTNDLGASILRRGRPLARRRHPLLRLRAAHHANRGGRAPSPPMAGADARVVRQPDHPQGVEHRHSRHRPPRAVTTFPPVHRAAR